MDTSLLITKLLAAILSLLDSANLRNRVYEQSARIESLELAIEDIERISASTASESERLDLIKGICSRITQ